MDPIYGVGQHCLPIDCPLAYIKSMDDPFTYIAYIRGSQLIVSPETVSEAIGVDLVDDHFQPVLFGHKNAPPPNHFIYHHF